MIIILPDIRSAHNVGSIFRTADAAGVEKIYLTGTTPAPIDRFGRPRADIAKVALGAEQTVSWEYVKDIAHLLIQLKQEGNTLIAVEQDQRSVNYRETSSIEKPVFIFGNEVDGVAKNILDQCDVIAEIPMYGEKESLNVAVTVGIILFQHKK
jgi:23S rRNA (guanosine2251-2'-O)-methyltransferase